jgi:hypothetical protein
MVNDEGQLYTIEGIAAAVLILTTVYLVLNSTMVFTPGETHIHDMQLEQIGTDVLAVMDLNTTWDQTSSPYPKSPLETFIENNQADQFKETFLLYSNSTSVSNLTTGEGFDNIQFTANISYNDGGQVRSAFFAKTKDYNRENAVRVTRWVNIDEGTWFGGEPREQTVLLEVLLWRG